MMNAGRSCRVLCCSVLLAIAAVGQVDGQMRGEDSRGDRPLARLNGEPIMLDDVLPEIAFQVYRRRLDAYLLLRRSIDELVEKRLLAAEAERRGVSVAALLAREVDAASEPAASTDVDAYLREHPEAADQPGARERVKHYLTEKRRIERRLAFLADLRKNVEFELLLQAPQQPRVRIDTTGIPSRGPADAPVTLLSLASFGSPRSARANESIRRLLVARPGKIRELFVALPSQHDETGLLAAQLAAAASAAGRFWEFHDRVFALGGRVRPEDLHEIAADLELADIEPGSTVHLGEVKRGIDRASRLGVEREPVMFVNGRYFSPTFPFENLLALVDEELGGPPAQIGAD